MLRAAEKRPPHTHRPTGHGLHPSSSLGGHLNNTHPLLAQEHPMNTSTPRPPTAHTHRGKPRPFTIDAHSAATMPDRAPAHRNPVPPTVPEPMGWPDRGKTNAWPPPHSLPATHAPKHSKENPHEPRIRDRDRDWSRPRLYRRGL